MRLVIMRMMLIDDCDGHDLDQQKVDDHEDDIDDCNCHELDEHDEHEGDYAYLIFVTNPTNIFV